MTIQHEPGSVVVCNVCYVETYGHDTTFNSTKLMLAAAKQAGWRRRLEPLTPGCVRTHKFYQDVCPACLAKEAQSKAGPTQLPEP